MARRHPWLHRVDKIYRLKDLLETMPLDHPSRKDIENMLKETEEADPVDYLAQK